MQIHRNPDTTGSTEKIPIRTEDEKMNTEKTYKGIRWIGFSTLSYTEVIQHTVDPRRQRAV